MNSAPNEYRIFRLGERHNVYVLEWQLSDGKKFSRFPRYWCRLETPACWLCLLRCFSYSHSCSLTRYYSSRPKIKNVYLLYQFLRMTKFPAYKFLVLGKVEGQTKHWICVYTFFCKRHYVSILKCLTTTNRSSLHLE